MSRPVRGSDLRAWLVGLAALAFAGGVVMVVFAAIAPTEAFAPFGLIVALVAGQHLPSPE